MKKSLQSKFLFLFFLISIPIFSQQKKIDSLQKALLTEKNDSLRATAYLLLANCYGKTGDYDSVALYANKGLTLYQKLNSQLGIADAYNVLGNYNTSTGNYPLAQDYWLKALRINEKMQRKNYWGDNLINIASVYTEEKKYDQSIQTALDGIKLLKEFYTKKDGSISTNGKMRIGHAYLIIGIAYNKSERYEQALEFMTQGEKLYEEINYSVGECSTLSDLGSIYSKKANAAYLKNDVAKGRNFDSTALQFYARAIALSAHVKNKRSLAFSIGNSGGSFVNLGEYKKAYDYLFRALALTDSIKAIQEEAEDYENLSELYAKSTLLLPDSIGGTILDKEHMRLRSLFFYKQFILLQDSVYGEENKKQLLQKEMTYDFEKKELKEKAEQDKKDAVAATEKRRQQLVTWFAVCAFLFVLFVAVYIFRSLRITRKQKSEIEKQKELVEQQKIIVEHQKEIVEEKQKEILDSIYYARRIQKSLLPTEKYISRNLNRLRK